MDASPYLGGEFLRWMLLGEGWSIGKTLGWEVFNSHLNLELFRRFAWETAHLIEMAYVMSRYLGGGRY